MCDVHCLAYGTCSGATEECPAILKYACILDTNAAPVKPARCHAELDADDMLAGGGGGEALASILNGKPLLALNFSNMTMTVADATVHDVRSSRAAQAQVHPAFAPA